MPNTQRVRQAIDSRQPLSRTSTGSSADIALASGRASISDVQVVEPKKPLGRTSTASSTNSYENGHKRNYRRATTQEEDSHRSRSSSQHKREYYYFNKVDTETVLRKLAQKQQDPVADARSWQDYWDDALTKGKLDYCSCDQVREDFITFDAHVLAEIWSRAKDIRKLVTETQETKYKLAFSDVKSIGASAKKWDKFPVQDIPKMLKEVKREKFKIALDDIQTLRAEQGKLEEVVFSRRFLIKNGKPFSELSVRLGI